MSPFVLLLACLAVWVPSGTAVASLPERGSVIRPDTVRPERHSREARKPMILPGSRLDTHFRTLPTQPASVDKVAPVWLKAKANGSSLYVIDGKPATASQLKNLHQSDVLSVEVLNGAKAANLYGSNARQGLVIITTKAGMNSKN